MRSRGFGRIRLQAESLSCPLANQTTPESPCLALTIHTCLPLLITDAPRSWGNNHETRHYLPGSAIRGLVLSKLAEERPLWFQEHKQELLTSATRFLDAAPNPQGRAILPSIQGFYENKEETVLEFVLTNDDFTPGLKRARLGRFCAIEEDEILYWQAQTSGSLRIQCKKQNQTSEVFQTRYLAAGQDLTGYILLDDISLAPIIAQVFAQPVWLGADRYEGYGKCRVSVTPASEPPWLAAYGYQQQAEIGCTLYLLALSPLCMLNEQGEPCGLDMPRLKQMLGVNTLALQGCASSLAEFSSFNRVWQSREPLTPMYDRGSVFRLLCDSPPQLAALRAIQQQGLGIRRAEGFGQVLFLRPSLLESVRAKRKAAGAANSGQTQAGAIRRARYSWLMGQADELNRCGLSKSQLGSVQALCEKALANDGDWSELNAFLVRNTVTRGAAQASRFSKIDPMLRKVLSTPLPETLGVGCADSQSGRIELFCQLIDYSRKVQKGGEGR